MYDIEVAVRAHARLGEGTVWDADAQVLWWVDIWSREIHRFEPRTGKHCQWQTPHEPGSLALRSNGNGLVVAMSNAIHCFDPSTGMFTLLREAYDANWPARFNDGRTDRQGRFWAGSTDTRENAPAEPVAALYRLDTATHLTLQLDRLFCSNGLAWSPDGTRMYHADSHLRRVWCCDFDTATGELAQRRLFIDMSEVGIPDGATTDAEGCYWIALWQAGRILRYDPDGDLMAQVELPTRAPTCCEFGGENLDVLYVSTANLQRGALSTDVTDPLAGSVLAMDARVRGVRSMPYCG
ncbi:MAG TPA: SMP-30/gluconolactonase/LRE family protein [Steroidobacter sp.]|uniref:SMP-30/gluconolactonase/LRE family protein n=1 Tax=Steroidobacter sp. TaxID=1978227 RepID=UPI002EDA84C2